MLYDITPAVSPEALAVWPGDTPVSRELLCDLARGDSVTLSTLRATVHLGAHADGPNHYGLNAPGIGERDLSYYIGPCVVVRVPVGRSERVPIGLVKDRLAELEGKSGLKLGDPVAGGDLARVLIATGTYPDPRHFNTDFAGLEPELVNHLHSRGVRLIGTDAPSVDLFDSKDLPAHARFLANDMAILETLWLSDVPEGVYDLIAPPLKLMGFDASPVRAVLRTLQQ